jgi:hypothetical protein
MIEAAYFLPMNRFGADPLSIAGVGRKQFCARNPARKMSFERAFQYFHGYIRSFLRLFMGTSSDVFDYFHDDN